MSEDQVYGLLKDFKYLVPQGGPMSGIGNDNQIVSLSNCFVIGNKGPSDSYGGIMKIDQLDDKIENMVVIGSSVGGTMMFNYLANYDRIPFSTILTGPQPYLKLPPWPIGQLLYNLPLAIFILSIRYAAWHYWSA